MAIKEFKGRRRPRAITGGLGSQKYNVTKFRKRKSKAITTEPADKGPEVSGSIADDAHNYLLGETNRWHFEGMLEAERIDWFTSRIVQVSRLNRTQHYKTIAMAYAVFARQKVDPLILGIIPLTQVRSFSPSPLPVIPHSLPIS